MAWQVDEDDAGATKRWPTASSRLNWARNNYRRMSLQEKLQKLLILMMNLTALDDLIEEEKGETYLKPRLKKEWRASYETFRPTKPVGRPKNGSGIGPTE